MLVSIIASNEQSLFEITDEISSLVRSAIETALAYEEIDFDAEISLTYTDNDGIRALNRDFRGRDCATDVLSFPMFDPNTEEVYALDGAPVELGDIVISLERAKEQSELYGHPFEREVAFLCVHSVLHLLGYDHERSTEEDGIMREKQRQIMHRLGLDVKGEVK